MRYHIAVLTLLGTAFLSPLSALAEENRVLRSFGNGAGPSAIGVVAARPDTEVEGPQAIASGDHGEIYLLDQVNNRVVAFDAAEPEGLTRSLSLPQGVTPTDLVVTGNRIYVWDGKPIRLDVTGDGPTRSLAPGAVDSADADEVTRSMFGQMGASPGDDQAAPEVTRGIGQQQGAASTQAREAGQQMLTSRGKGAVVTKVTLGKGEKSASIIITARSTGAEIARLLLQVRDQVGTVEVLDIDKDGKAYVLAENVPVGNSSKATSFVARFSAKSALEGVYEMPLTPDVALSRRYVTVNSDGEVYFMRTRKNVVEVIAVGFRPFNKGQVVDLQPPSLADVADIPRDDPGRQPVAAVRPQTRPQMMRIAQAFADVKWRVTPTSYGGEPDYQCTGFNGRLRRPPFVIGKVGQEVRGIPYCWGCMGSLPQIATRIDRGMKAGNVCTRNNPRQDSAGVDCSGFVSAAWGLQTHFATVAIPAISSQVMNPWDMKPGDALNKPGSHVMLFAGFTADRKAQVFEASPGACNGRVCRNVYPLGSLLARGYVPRRYRAVIEDVAFVPQPAPKTPARGKARPGPG